MLDFVNQTLAIFLYFRCHV